MNKVFGGRYQVGEMIGAGGMADVYVAEDLRLNRKVAIKVLRSDLARDPSFISRFKKEALAAAGLNHPGIVAVYDSGEEENNSYIVMELVTGHTLRELLNSGTPIPEVEALRITAGILDALEYSHQNGIVHRDIKPSNIMLTDSGDVKVMDFGIARATDDSGATMTSTWNVVGTAQYLSPEQATGDIADGRSDIYSVGCLMYELLTGRTPFTGETPVAIAYQHVSANFIPPTEVNEDLDPNLDTILSIALAKDPAERYQTAHEMLRDITLVRQGEAVTAKFRRVIPRHNFIVLGAAALATILLVTTAFLIMPASKSKVPTISVADVRGLSEAVARERLAGFTITTQQVPDQHVPTGLIAGQIPYAHSLAPAGSSVTLLISQGSVPAIVPADLVGKSLADATNEIRAAGLSIAQTIPINSNQNPGVVLKVLPDGGSSVPAGSGIILQFASGNVQVPNFLGADGITAQNELSQAGLIVKIIYATDKTQPANVVLAQSPSGGTTQSIGSNITITVNQIPTN